MPPSDKFTECDGVFHGYVYSHRPYDWWVVNQSDVKRRDLDRVAANASIQAQRDLDPEHQRCPDCFGLRKHQPVIRGCEREHWRGTLLLDY